MTSDEQDAPPQDTPGTCLCSHDEDHHWIFGDCMHKSCGCQSYRPDVQRAARQREQQQRGRDIA